MKKLIFVFTSWLVLLGACQDESSSLGESLVKTSFKNIVTDTCTIQFSTILVDSLETLGDSVCQIGAYRDEVFGKVTASYLTEYEVASFTPNEASTYMFDSITVTFLPSGHYWGDTLTAQRIHIHEIDREFYLDADETLYNTSLMPVKSNPLCSFSYLPHPGKKKEMEIRIPDSFGKKWFDDLLAEKEAFDSQDKFRTYFHGLAFMPEENGSCISGFMVSDSSMVITMYYHEITDSPQEMELEFAPNRSYAFTHVDHDRSGTPVEALTPGGALFPTYSEKLQHKGYLQGLTGIYNAIEFPHLNNLQWGDEVVSIESATLYLYPEKGSYGNTSQLPTSLRLYIADENNTIQDQVYDSMGTTIQDGSLVVDNEYGINTYYSFDLTSFMQDNLGTWGVNRQKLFLTLDDDDFVCTFDQIIFSNDPSQDSGQMKLYIRYKTYNKQ